MLDCHLWIAVSRYLSTQVDEGVDIIKFVLANFHFFEGLLELFDFVSFDDSISHCSFSTLHTICFSFLAVSTLVDVKTMLVCICPAAFIANELQLLFSWQSFHISFIDLADLRCLPDVLAFGLWYRDLHPSFLIRFYLKMGQTLRSNRSIFCW